MKKYLLTPFLVVGFFPHVALAHCPLCTVGAGALAVLAASIGVAPPVVGILVGAFSVALGLWIAGMVQTQYIVFQRYIIATIVFFGTVVPIAPLVRAYAPLYISIAGPYGTLLHNTYTVNVYALGVLVGAAVMLVAPPVSRMVARLRRRHMPFQGITITVILLAVVSTIAQLLS